MTTYDFSRLGRNFDMTNPVTVGTTGAGDPIVAYTNEWQGREYAHIRTLWQDRQGDWHPGKGVSFPANEIEGVLEQLIRRFTTSKASEMPANRRGVSASAMQPKTASVGPRVNKDALLTSLKGQNAASKGNGRSDLNLDQLGQFIRLSVQLSPENLTMDGELSRSQVQKRTSALHAQWKALEKAIGRKVTEDEVWNAERQQQSRRR
jgi:hypothetical protein